MNSIITKLKKVYQYVHVRWPFFLPASWHLKILFKRKMGYKLDLKNPTTFNEKLQWLKLHDHNPLYSKLVDKYEVKEFVAKKIGSKCVIPSHGVYDDFDDIDFSKLPNKFVIKCTHDSGGVVICPDKKKFDLVSARKLINNRLNRKYYYYGREWPYKNVKPRIVVEKYMVDESGYELKDYKFFCFNGVPKYVQVDFNRFVKHTKNIYDINWKFQDVQINYPNDKKHKIAKPKNLKKMIDYAKILAKGTRFVRVDFYSIKDKVYFGEITFYPGSGLMPFTPKEWDYKFGEMIDLNKEKSSEK